MYRRRLQRIPICCYFCRGFTKHGNTVRTAVESRTDLDRGDGTSAAADSICQRRGSAVTVRSWRIKLKDNNRCVSVLFSSARTYISRIIHVMPDRYHSKEKNIYIYTRKREVPNNNNNNNNVSYYNNINNNNTHCKVAGCSKRRSPHSPPQPRYIDSL